MIINHLLYIISGVIPYFLASSFHNLILGTPSANALADGFGSGYDANAKLGRCDGVSDLEYREWMICISFGSTVSYVRYSRFLVIRSATAIWI